MTTVQTPLPPVRRSSSGWRTVVVVLGAALILIGTTLLAIGAVGLWADHQRGDDGYFSAGPERLTTESSVLTAPSLDVNGSGPDSFYTEDLLGDLRINGESKSAGALFIGIGPAAEVAVYLAGVNHTEVSDIEVDPFEASYTQHPGERPVADPAAQNFWVASDTGTGPRSLTWDVKSGDWAAVIMNADGSPGIDAQVGVAATLTAIRDLAIGALIGGALMLGAGVVVLVSTFPPRGGRRQEQDGIAR